MKLLGRGRERNGALTKVGVVFWGRQFVDNDNEDSDNEDNDKQRRRKNKDNHSEAAGERKEREKGT